MASVWAIGAGDQGNRMGGAWQNPQCALDVPDESVSLAIDFRLHLKGTV
jgi:hypothetical protein